MAYQRTVGSLPERSLRSGRRERTLSPPEYREDVRAGRTSRGGTPEGGSERPPTTRGGRTQTLERGRDSGGKPQTTRERGGSRDRRSSSRDRRDSSRERRSSSRDRRSSSRDRRSSSRERPQTVEGRARPLEEGKPTAGRPHTTRGRSTSKPPVSTYRDSYQGRRQFEKDVRKEFKKMSLTIPASGAKQPSQKAPLKAEHKPPTPALRSPQQVGELTRKPSPPPGSRRVILIGNSPRGVGKFEPGRYATGEPVSGSFEKNLYAEGRHRTIYKGVYHGPPHKRGKECILKEEKGLKARVSPTYKTTLQIYKIAQNLAEEFNRERISHMALEYVDADVSFSDFTQYDGGPREEQGYLIEDFIPGKFMKWCNNYGYISDDSTTLPAFMHWTFVRTEGRMMVGDLQGVRAKRKFILTDPAIMSTTTNHFYGNTDTGVEGIALFFKNHDCSQMCRNLPKPSLHDILALLPAGAQDQVDKFEMSTVRTDELLMPLRDMHEVIQLFNDFAKTLKKY